MSMIYTVEEVWSEETSPHTTRRQTYEGFRRYSAKKPEEATCVAVVIEQDGETSVWWLQDRGLALEELQRYYRMDGCGDNISIKVFNLEEL